MSVKKWITFLIYGLILSGFAFGQVYEAELKAYDLPGLQKKLALIDATIRTEPVVAYFLQATYSNANYPIYTFAGAGIHHGDIPKKLRFLDSSWQFSKMILRRSRKLLRIVNRVFH